MRSTRKKIIKTVYKDENDSDEETGDFSDSGSEAQISEHSSSEEDNEPIQSSSDEFTDKSKRSRTKAIKSVKKTKFAKNLISKINKNSDSYNDDLDDTPTTLLSVKDLTEADKLLPSVLNLSESDSSDDESTKPHQRKPDAPTLHTLYEKEPCGDSDTKVEYKDVWSCNVQENSEEIANKAFQELEQHKNRIDKTKASIQSYELKKNQIGESNVSDLLALGEEVLEETKVKKTSKSRKKVHESDSENEDWEEVKESKTIPPQGLQLIVDIPNAYCKKKKAQDVEMMMKRKINRVKKEYQIYMHKVHVLCWLAHGNYVSCVINNQEILTAALSIVPSQDCYPKERVDMKYVEQITKWYHDKMTIIQDKYENKFKPKAPPLKQLLLDQIKKRKASTKKYLVFIFVSMLRALGLQCRVMFNFVTLPIKPPSSELCSLSTKTKSEKTSDKANTPSSKIEKPIKDKIKKKTNTKKSKKIPQIDGNYDIPFSSDSENIMQVDGNDDSQGKSKSVRTRARKAKEDKNDNTDVSPPKRVRKTLNTKPNTVKTPIKKAINKKETVNSECALNNSNNKSQLDPIRSRHFTNLKNVENNRTSNSRNSNKTNTITKIEKKASTIVKNNEINIPKIEITNDGNTASKYFDNQEVTGNKNNLTLKRKRSTTNNPSTSNNKSEDKKKQSPRKTRTKSAPGNFGDKSEYFTDKRQNSETSKIDLNASSSKKSQESRRVSHRDLMAKSKVTAKNDVTSDLIGIIKNRVKEAKTQAKRGVVKGKQREESDDDSDYLSEEPVKHYKSDDEDFKPTKISPRASTSRKPIDRRVLSSDEEIIKHKSDVWCEIFVEELEQWVSVDVVNAKVHCTSALYSHSTHPVCYIVGWDNNNKLKDLTRRYVPHWNTVTRKQRAEIQWWNKAILPWLGPKNARDKEEDVQLDRMQLEAPLPKSISEYKNHPLYVLKRHLLKFEAIYPPDAATLGFVRNDPVYARECVYVCRSRDTWLKEAKVVKLGEKPYKIVKARPKWDKLSNKLITDKMLEVFGPWQVQDYEPPIAENGVVPRNAYGNVELFKACMLPKGTVHVKLPGLNKVARKLNIDCAPAMTGFDFNGGWSHPVFDGFVVCQEFEEIIVEAWLKDQEEQERKEREKTEARVYGNWKRLIKGLLIRERLKNKYGFEEPSTSTNKTQKSKGPRLVVKKKS